jgi:tetratricopeptide (TPR) repeat protein
MRPAPKFLLAAVLLAAAGVLAGCVRDTKLNEIERAKLIKEKRNDARDVFAKWKASDGRDRKLLEKYVRLHRETTEIAPATCPACWASYGEALSTLGWYYWDIYTDILEELEEAPPAAAADLRQEAAEYRREWEKYFNLSNRAYETHFRSPDVPAVHPYSFERVMRHHEQLGNYERALYYLSRCLDAYPRIDDFNRQKFEKLRRLYQLEAQRQKEREVNAPQPAQRSRGDARGAAPSTRRSGRSADLE